MMMGSGIAGKVTSVGTNSVMVESNGKSTMLKLDKDSRILNQDRQQGSLGDIKAGAYVIARGAKDGDSISARMLMITDEATVKKMEEAQANFGKTNIAGEVKQIDDTKLTILRPDGQTQVIEVDETTSMKKNRESITLADIKVGDRIMAPSGEMKNGVFVPKELRVFVPGQMRRREGGQDAPASVQKPTDQPK